MTGKFLRQSFQFITDRNLHPYWVSRALVASLFFLFGILLRDAGLINEKVIIAWIVVGVAQGAVLLGLDHIAKKFRPRIHWYLVHAFAAVALVSVLVMTVRGLEAGLFTLATVAILPLIRELTHDGMIHIRDRKDWVLGNNVAFLYANEASKGLGAAFIVLLGYFSSLGSEWVAGFLAVLFVLCIGQSFLGGLKGEREPFDPNANIGPIGRRYVLINFVHNGAFSSSKWIMSLVLFDLISKTTGVENVIMVVAGGLSITMILGMVAIQPLNNRIRELAKGLPGVSILTLSLLALTGHVLAGAGITIMALTTAIEPIILGYGLAMLIAGMMAFGGLFSLGTMKFLDTAFRDNPDLRKSTLHYCWIGSAFSPSVFMSLYLVLDLAMPSIHAGAWILGVIALIEIAITFYAHKTSQRLATSHEKGQLN